MYKEKIFIYRFDNDRASINFAQKKVLGNWGWTEKKSASVDIPALYLADTILPAVVLTI
jgi:hypothetical protein